MFFEDDFFKKEVKCGFEISEMMKRAWAAQMEVLSVLDDICRKNQLRYFADWGTLLGAIRHQGFIPWDDDIDICLKREDYNQLIQILPQELPKGFVLAGMYAQEKRLQQAAFTHQLRVIADETLWNFNDYMKYFHGFPYQRAGIDIFPLDYLSPDEEIVNLQKMIVINGRILLDNWELFQQNGELESRLLQMEEWCDVKLPRNDSTVNKLWRLLDSVISLYHEDECAEIVNFTSFCEHPEYRMKKEWYAMTEYKKFENMQVPVPHKYHEVLTTLFGDYMIWDKNVGRAHGYPFYRHMEKDLEEEIAKTGFTGTVDEFCRKVSNGELRV